jgi:hypothetical protein
MTGDSAGTRFKAFFGQAPVPLFVHKAGSVRYLNSACVATLGATDASQIVGKSIMQFITAARISECSAARRMAWF